QLVYDGLARRGGICAVLLVHALVLVSVVALGLRTARALGASVPSVVLAGLAALTVAPWALQMRTQDLGELAFVVVLSLLALDARKHSRRVFLVVPLLFVWANLHGSVVLGAGLVALRALLLVRRQLPRALALFAAAVVSPLVAPVTAIRNIVWFGLTALVLLPWLVDPLVGSLDFRRFRGFVRPLAALTLASIVATAAYAASRPAGWYVREWPEAQSGQIAAAAGRTRSVFADDRYADWLLWTEPQLRGRVAYDVRFELFSPKQLELLVGYRNRTGA